ncbi:helix-turn-helix domain-containing protein [Ruminococcus sp.]|uniref:helix-turn-helix domain-containing protein n=1 Tax=Ruminococcus sp. TaxID=41978 RepID=UPI001B23A810|nr:helix-turn-helix domain-containing protein [Ruminococcus sp.]MBO5557247.1 helix-turn-helix domain-containing protein [Ruminococcus sp.]
MARAETLYDKMFTDYPDVVGVPDLMKMLSVGKHAAYQLVREGTVQSFKVGRKIKIPKLSIIEFLLDRQGDDAIEKNNRQPSD